MIFDRLQRLYNRYAQTANLTQVIETWRSGRSLPSAQDFRLLADEGYRQSAIIYACIREKATSAVEPACLVEQEVRGEWQPVARTHPLVERLQAPNDSDDLPRLMERSVTHLDIAGNTYLHKVRSAGGTVVGLYTLRPDRMRIIPAADGTILRYDFVVGDIVKHQIPFDDIIHLKYDDPLDDYYGLSPLVPAGRVGDVDNQAIEYMRSFFFNRGIPSGLLKFKARTTPEQRDRIREQWAERYVGPQGWHQVSVLDEDVAYEELSQGLASLNVQPVFDATESRLCMIFGVPPIVIGAKVGLMHGTYANYKEARRSFWQETLSPLYKKYERALTKHLASEYGPHLRIRFDTSQVAALQEDFESRRKFALQAWNSSLMTRNEALARSGEPLCTDDALGAQYKSDISNKAAPQAGAALAETPLTAPPRPSPRLRLADPEPSWQELHRVADAQVRAMQRAWRVALRDLRAQIDPDMLQAALESQNLVLAMQAVPVAQVLASRLTLPWEGTITTLVADGAEVAYQALAMSVPADFAFNLAHPAAENWIKAHAADLVTQVSDNTRLGIREVILQSFEEAIAPKDTARILADFVGLRDDQVRSVMKARARLEDAGVSGEQLEARVARLVRKQKVERGLLIARTETINAANHGQLELWDQAVEADLLEPDRSYKEWIVTPDDRLCELCAPLDGQRVLLKDYFETANGPKSAPGLHPR